MLVVVGVVLRFLLPTPLHVQVVHHMPRRVSVCVRPNCSSSPPVLLVVRHLPPHVAKCVRSNYSISPRGAWGHCSAFMVTAGVVRTTAGGMRSFVVDTGVVPLWWPGWFVTHCVRTVVLGSSHPSFVGGSFPLLTNLKNRAAGVPSVALRVPHPLRAQTSPHDISGAPVVVHWVPDPLNMPSPCQACRAHTNGCVPSSLQLRSIGAAVSLTSHTTRWQASQAVTPRQCAVQAGKKGGGGVSTARAKYSDTFVPFVAVPGTQIWTDEDYKRPGSAGHPSPGNQVAPGGALHHWVCHAFHHTMGSGGTASSKAQRGHCSDMYSRTCITHRGKLPWGPPSAACEGDAMRR